MSVVGRPSLERANGVMRVGLDLDGTIIVYDEVFHRHAVARFGLPGHVPVRKNSVREWLRSNEPGEQGWIELQRLVYGPKILEAAPAPGVIAFLHELGEAGVEVSIISHKDRYSAAAPPVDLRAAAIDWLEEHGFFAPDGFVDRARTFFEATRTDKLRRIEREACAAFVDDLEEVLSDPAFPNGVERWLYAPESVGTPPRGVQRFSDWESLARRLLGRPA